MSGIGTRLLDWTRNPLAALWFVVNKPPRDYKTYGIVWIFKPEDKDVIDFSKDKKPFAIKMMEKIIFLLYVNIILIALSACDLKANDKSPHVVKAIIEGSTAEPEAFLFSHSEKTCKLLSNGEGSCRGLEKENKPILFKLGLKESDRLITIFSFQHIKDIYLIYEAHDEESGYGAIIRLDGQSLQSKWSTHIQGFNIGEGLVYDGFLYISAFGFIGKIDLATGNYVWKHSDLYRPPDYFNSFEKPTIAENIIYFPESKPTYLKRQPLIIKVNNTTGAIIR